MFIFVAVINGLIFMAVETNRIEYKQCLTEDLEKEVYWLAAQVRGFTRLRRG